ncbi:hypothetical protein BJ085DRAFT_30927 [Dimargaris cristalligena]|uniref:FAD dependent oxidoreductase domain-containing protein n=1 Tax=Dimargaris cristalligena TaxID=215637 RepID=A0A4P9ZT56_9FUNG|nr:hypothetical protein BJ085DRAFT_30927 [Dimargaris cristalligena]|eukprot:RKP36378.1 hypothetical protein BJ085DRAFT_30927 [Dimargaris cristalligena]
MATQPCVKVLGGGVVGLTTALVLRQSRYAVTVLAKDLPGQAGNAQFASPSAGAHWRSWADAADVRLQRFEELTLARLFELARKHPECGIVPTRSFDYWEEIPQGGARVWFDKLVPEFRTLAPEELVPNTKMGVTYKKIAINVPVYLQWVYQQCIDAGVKVVRLDSYYSDVNGAFTHEPQHPTADIVVNCTGLGARTLGGVEDLDVYSVRGQWMLVRAPSVKDSINVTTKPGPVAMMTTIIPRGDGTVFLGGSKESSSYDATVNKATSDIIWERCTSVCPELVADYNAWNTQADKTEPFVLAEGAGLRPGRVGGPRVDMEPQDQDRYLIHNYGHAGYGYQTSWSCAWEVLAMVQGLLPAKE